MNESNPQPPRSPAVSSSALIPGAIILIMGVGFLLSNFGLLHFQVWCLWPLFLVAIGLAKLTQRTVSSTVLGLAFIGFGAAFLLQCFGVITFDAWKLWPLFLIAIGVRILMRTVEGPAAFDESRQRRGALRDSWRQQRREARDSWRQQRSEWHNSWWQHAASRPASMVADQWLHVVAVFTEERRRITNPNFVQAEAVAVFGSCQIDLRAIGIPDHAVTIEANAVFGGVEIFIPTTWDVLLKGVGIFGVYQDETIPAVAVEGRRGQLIVRGVSAFGGVTVKN